MWFMSGILGRTILTLFGYLKSVRPQRPKWPHASLRGCMFNVGDLVVHQTANFWAPDHSLAGVWKIIEIYNGPGGEENFHLEPFGQSDGNRTKDVWSINYRKATPAEVARAVAGRISPH